MPKRKTKDLIQDLECNALIPCYATWIGLLTFDAREREIEEVRERRRRRE